MAEPTSIDTLTNLGGTGAIVLAFLWYLSKRDVMINDSLNTFASKMDELSKAMNSLSDRLDDIQHPKRKKRV